MRLLALAALLAFLAAAAIPVVRAQQPPYIHFEPATGPVVRYEARVRTRTVADTGLVAYEDVRYLSPDATPLVELATVPAEPYWIDVRSVGATDTSDWSLMHSILADLDENGGVGAGDVIVLSQEWGQPDRGAAMFLEMMQHWGDVTVWDEVLLFRRYVMEGGG